MPPRAAVLLAAAFRVPSGGLTGCEPWSAAAEHLGGQDVAAQTPAAFHYLVDEDEGVGAGTLSVHVGVGVRDRVDELLLRLRGEGVGRDLEVGEGHGESLFS